MIFNIWIVGTLISMPLLAEESEKLQSPLVCMFWPVIWPAIAIWGCLDQWGKWRDRQYWNGVKRQMDREEECGAKQYPPAAEETAASVRDGILGMCPEEEKFYRDNNLD